jgi:hypothetical protein
MIKRVAPDRAKLARAPTDSPTQPTRGLSRGMHPGSAIDQTAMTRPRNAGSVSNCTSALARAMNQIETHPVSTRPA